MKMEPIVSSETSAIRTQTPGNYPKRNNLHLEHGESLRTRLIEIGLCYLYVMYRYFWLLDKQAAKCKYTNSGTNYDLHMLP